MEFDWQKAVKRLKENYTQPSTLSYIQTVLEIIQNLNPPTLREKRNLEVAIQHLKEIRRGHKKLMSENFSLNERLKILEENSNKEE